MVTVTKLEPVGKSKYRTGFDNGMTCLLYSGEVRRLSLTLGDILDDSVYDTIMEEILKKRAIKRAMHLLEQMDRSESRLREKLAQGEYPQECIDTAIEYVKSYNYLNDLRYAQTYIRYHMEGMSRQQLTLKLMQKGIGREDIRQALDDEYVDNEENLIMALLDKKHFNPTDMNEKEKQRIYQYILRRGFKSNDILRCMRKYLT